MNQKKYLKLLYIFLPIFIANSFPVLVKKIPILKNFTKPINENIFWKNKTYRWFIFWIFWAIIFSIIQFKLSKNKHFKHIKIIQNDIKSSIFIWFLLWFWALFWDLIKSYFKRKIWIKPWEKFLPWDLIDYIIWSLIFIYPYYVSKIDEIFFLMFIWAYSSKLANIISFNLWIKDVPY